MNTSDPQYVSRKNRKGLLAVIVIGLIIVYTPRIIFFFRPEEKFTVTSEDIKELREEQQNEYQERGVYSDNFRYDDRPYKRSRFNAPPSKFNPNEYTEQEWQALGLSKKQVAVVLKFTKRGIYSNDQLSKIFVIPPELYDLIKDSTVYPAKQAYSEQNRFAEVPPKKFPEKEKILVDINTANQEELEKIPGIGPFFAKNIIKQRDRLGGFHLKSQLLEVWKMDEEKYQQIKEFVSVSGDIRQININTATAAELKAHPYLNWNIANSIVKIREQHGEYKKIEDIKKSLLINEELFEKIKPYLTL